MTPTTIQEHFPLEDNLIGWTTLRGVLAKALLEIEQGVWQDKFEHLDNPTEIKDRNPEDLTDDPNMPLERALRTAPGLRGLLDNALLMFTLDDHVYNAVEHGFDLAVHNVTHGISGPEMDALQKLAEDVIRDGPEALGPMMPEDGHVLWQVTVRDIAATHDARAKAEGGPAWSERPEWDRLNILQDCSQILQDRGAENLAGLVEETTASRS